MVSGGSFTLIGEALSVPKDGVFIVDEPELHLHRAIQARLWDAVEIARPDCTFVYITHDLGFAASRKDATKVWLREYNDGKWDSLRRWRKSKSGSCRFSAKTRFALCPI